MKKNILQNRPLTGLLCGAAALAVAALAPQSASAAGTPGSAANAKILNVVTVNYYDATGKNGFQAATSTSVTVALKQAPLSVATITPFTTVDSGQTTTSYVGLTSNANGSDSYTVSFSDSASNLQLNSATTNLVTDISGGTSTSFSSGGTVTLGATSIVSVAAPTGGNSQVISIPGGTLNGIGVGSVVVISDISYKVTAVTAGSQASYSNTGTQTGTGTLTGETLGTITITTDSNGSKTPPNLSGAVAGLIVGERKYLQIADSGTVTSNTTNGTDTFTVNTGTTTGSNPSTVLTNMASFAFASLNITKTVTNKTKGGVAGVTGTGQPTDVLEYVVTVTNPSGVAVANKVSITDAVPAYTTLVSGSAYGATDGNGAATEIFATINDGTYTVNATLNTPGNQTQPGGATVTGYGGTAGGAITAGTGITFYLGTVASSSAGGNIAPGKTYTISYRVKIN